MISEILEDHPIIKNIKRDLELMRCSDSEKSLPITNAILRINSELIVRFPELFADPDLYMTGPVGQLMDGTIVEAKSRKFETRWTAETAGSEPYDPNDEEILSRLVDAFGAELKAFLAHTPGQRFCPYMPVLSTGFLLDPTTHDPVASFMTRFGEAPPAKVSKPIDGLDDHPLIQNVKKYTDRNLKSLPNYERTAEFIIKLNKALISRYPELFENKARYMTAPTMQFDDVTEPVQFHAKRLSHVEGVRNIDGPDFGVDIDDLVVAIAGDIKAVFREYAGSEYCPYIPVTSSGPMVDPASFISVMNFMTRFGHIAPRPANLDHPLMKNVAAVMGDTPMTKGMLIFNSILIARHPDLFGNDVLYMKTPSDVKRDQRGKRTIEAMTMKLETKWTFEAAGSADEQTILGSFADNIADEIRDYLRLNHNTRFCPYVPAMANGTPMIDPETGEAYVKFMTRFGLWR